MCVSLSECHCMREFAMNDATLLPLFISLLRAHSSCAVTWIHDETRAQTDTHTLTRAHTRTHTHTCRKRRSWRCICANQAFITVRYTILICAEATNEIFGASEKDSDAQHTQRPFEHTSSHVPTLYLRALRLLPNGTAQRRVLVMLRDRRTKWTAHFLLNIVVLAHSHGYPMPSSRFGCPYVRRQTFFKSRSALPFLVHLLLSAAAAASCTLIIFSAIIQIDSYV